MIEPTYVRVLAAALVLATSAVAVAGPPAPRKSRLSDVQTQTVVWRSGGETGGGVAGNCDPVVVAHTESDFGAGQYVAQAGIIEGEIAATSYVLPAAAFPVRIDLMEFLFATSNASVATTMVYRIRVWEGRPEDGAPVFAATSDGDVLPHLVMPPGTTGVNLQFLVDPGDPDQIFVQDSGNQTVSIGIEIVEHHSPPANQCLVSPDPSLNAFPCTDVDGLQVSAGNWIYVEDCGAFACPAGWKRFSDLSFLCRPSGDWVQRLTWTPTSCGDVGACCVDTDCISVDEATCLDAGGQFRGVGTSCALTDCETTSPCCFVATGGCVDLDPLTCVLAGGAPGPAGAACDQYVCFPSGACCLPDGSCVDGTSPESCIALAGVFQGDGTSCSAIECPEPVGASCFSNGFCLLLTEAEAIAAGASWKGAGTDCADADGDGVPDACVSGPPGDFNGDGRVDGADLGIFLVGWGQPGPTDLSGDGTTDGTDLGAMLVSWTG